MNNLEMVEQKEREFDKLYQRMDIDAAHVRLKPYIMMRLDNKTTPVDNVVNVTMNFPATYIDDLCNAITNASMQVVIAGWKNNRKLNEKEAGLVEQFINANYGVIDEILAKKNGGRLITWESHQISERGRVCGCFWPHIDKKGKYIPDFRPWDTRFVAFQKNRYGEIVWASYRTKRRPSDVNTDYPGADAYGDTPLEVVIYLNDTFEEIWINKVQFKRGLTDKHNFGFVPVIYQMSPRGAQMRDEGYEEHEGESALWLDRGLYDELNRSVSIEQTLAMKSVLPAYVHEEQSAEGPEQPYPDKVAANTGVPVGEIPQLLQVADLKMGAQLGRTDILTALQSGGRNIDLGNVQQSFSAVAIAAIDEIRKKVLVPSYEAISMFRQQGSRMLIEQYKTLAKRYGFKGEIGIPGSERSYPLEGLDGSYSIDYKFLAKSKELEIANIAVATAARGIVPRKVINRDILQVENLNEFEAMLKSEEVEAADPVIALLRLAHALVDEADGLDDAAYNAKIIESQRLTEKAVQMMEAEAMGQAQPVEKPEKGNAQPLMPLLGGGNRRQAALAGGRQ